MRIQIILFTIIFSLLSIGCGGSGGGDSDSPAANDSGGDGISARPADRPFSGISGVVYDSALMNANVTAYDYETMDELGTGTTNSSGEYQVSIQVSDRPVLIVVTDGTYREEASGASISLLPNQKLYAAINYVSGDDFNVPVTYFTSIAVGLADHLINNEDALISEAIGIAYARISTAINIDISAVTPVDTTEADNNSVELTDEIRYGYLIAGISQYSLALSELNNGPNHSIFTSKDLLQRAYDDISNDGVLDGIGSAGQISVSNINLDTESYRLGIGNGVIDYIDAGPNALSFDIDDLLPSLVNFIGNNDPIYNAVVPGHLTTPEAYGSVYGVVFTGGSEVGAASIEVSDYQTGDVLSTANTNYDGEYRAVLRVTSRPLVIRVLGGNYSETTSGSSLSRGDDEVLLASINYVSGVDAQSSVSYLTTVSTALSRYNVSLGGIQASAAINDANTRLSNVAGFNILSTAPTNTNDANNSALNISDSVYYGYFSAGVSGYSDDISDANGGSDHSLFSSAEYITFAYNDILSDGVFNGLGSQGQVIAGAVVFDTESYRQKISEHTIEYSESNENELRFTAQNLVTFLTTFVGSVDPIFNNAPTPSISPIAPLISDLLPLEGAYVTGSISLLSVVGGPFDIDTVEYLIGNTVISTLNGGNTDGLMDTSSYPDGAYILTVRATNIIGNAASISNTINIANNVSPTINSLIPLNNSTLEGVTTLSVHATDLFGLSSVEFLVGSTSIGFASNLNSPSISLNTASYSDGSKTITAKATNINGNTSSTSNNVFFDNLGPVLLGLTTSYTLPDYMMDPNGSCNIHFSFRDYSGATVEWGTWNGYAFSPSSGLLFGTQTLPATPYNKSVTLVGGWTFIPGFTSQVGVPESYTSAFRAESDDNKVLIIEFTVRWSGATTGNACTITSSSIH